jgi:4-hydroxy-3-methylbut-2-enyl diphosphate reductase
MKITTARFGGFCFGVKRAIDIALKSATGTDAQVCMLGDIVHNENVIRQVEAAGIQRIKRLGRGAGKTLLLSAHGTGATVIDAAQRRGYKIIDATCPMVKSIHTIARRKEQEGYTIIIIGDRDHSEVHGIIGQLKYCPVVIERLHHIPVRELKNIKRAAVVVQSTQNIENVLKMIDEIRSYIPDLQFFNTICKPTRMRQAEMRTMPLENDVMIIIGSHTSANTRRLCEISHALNSRTYCVESKNDLKPEWFKGARSVGVASGASTPDSIIQETIAHLRQISK